MKLSGCLVMALAVWLPSLAATDAWGQAAWRPEKPVELVTASAAGGSNDRVARVIQKIMQDEKLAPVPVSVLNKPGGNQTL